MNKEIKQFLLIISKLANMTCAKMLAQWWFAKFKPAPMDQEWVW